MDELTVFDAQIILYAKGWYKRDSDIEDVRVLIAKISGMEIAHVSDLDIITLVADTMHKLGNFTNSDMQSLYKDLWRTNLFNAKKTITMSDMIRSHLSVIRYKNGKEVNTLLLKNGPDSKYLPLNSDAPKWEEQKKYIQKNLI